MRKTVVSGRVVNIFTNVKLSADKQGIGRAVTGQTVFRKAIHLMVVMCVACFAGCTVEYPYFYISLEQETGIQVGKVGRVALTGLSGGVVVPLEYSLRREGYTLNFAVIQESAHPAVRVAVAGNEFSLRFQRDMSVRAPNGVVCASYYPATTTAFSFGWDAGCTAPQLTRAIEFDVIDSGGDVVARERIRFDLRENGSYTAVDTI